MKLIDVAARYGSVDVFKFLMLSGAVITDKTTTNAVESGCLEIIRILQRKGMKFIGCYTAAVECNRNEIADWIHNNYDVEIITLANCMKCANYSAANFCLLNGFDINAKHIEWKYTIHYFSS